MDIERWMEIYSDIADDLSISIEDDLNASREFSDLITQNPGIDLNQQVLRELKEMIAGKDCVIFGTSPDLESTLIMSMNDLEGWGRDNEKVLIAADGASSILLSLDIIPDVIVTDLDGGIEDQLTCGRMGAYLLVHAHGDNREVVRRIVPRLSGKVLGTTQVHMEPNFHLYNFGGFTDGDRAVMMADELGAGSITLIGFDLKRPGGKVLDGGRRKALSHDEELRKKKKLIWAQRIISMVRIEIGVL